MRHALKVLFAVALVFSFVSIANADSMPDVVDAKNQPKVWTETVYTAAAITSGYIVRWVFEDCDTTGYVDMCPWVELCETASDVWTAGVVPIDYNIAAGSTFDMIIRGPAFVKKIAGDTCTAGIIVDSTTTGTVIDETASGGDNTVLGISIHAESTLTRPDLGTSVAIIYIDPTLTAN